MRAERAARGEPPLPEAGEWCVAAYRLAAAGYPGGAAEAWRRALAAEGNMPQAHLGLGRALLDLGDADDSAASFRSAEECHRLAAERGLEPLLEDPDEDPWYPLGLAEHMAGRLDAALAAYARAAKAYPWFAEPVLESVRTELARGNREVAAAAGPGGHPPRTAPTGAPGRGGTAPRGGGRGPIVS